MEASVFKLVENETYNLVSPNHNGGWIEECKLDWLVWKILFTFK